MNVHYSSKSNEWETPQWLFDRLNDVFHFTLDPCSTDQNFKTRFHYTIETNGLDKPWTDEIVFMNPPYGKEQDKWIEKAMLYNTLCLIPARTETKRWHKFIFPFATNICFLNFRVKYTINGVEQGSPSFPSALVWFGPHKELSSLKDLGHWI